MKQIYILILFITCYLNAFSQSNESEIESTLVDKIAKVYSCNDELCIEGRNQDFRAELLQFIHSGDAFNFTFNELKNKIGIIESSDHKVKIFTWNTVDYNNKFTYYCFILHKKNHKKKEYDIIELKDYSKKLNRIENKTLNEHKWFGALYFDIIPVKKDNKIFYTVLGWDGNNPYTDKKIIDVFTVNNGKAFFGYPMFKLENKIQNRYILEFKAESYCSLKYFIKKETIVFDKMQPINPEAEGIYEFYMSLGILSSFKWDKKQELWMLEDNYTLED